MDSHPKVMTVSYGTFSCTLDGFDDPFTTMQLVAEYFRKLSADDRYFGSEPLQPDASKLHQIAKVANPNRIDAEVTDNSVILRQADIIEAAPEVKPAQVEINEKPQEIVPEIEEPVEVAVEVAVESTKATFSSQRSAQAAVAEQPATDKVRDSLEQSITDTDIADELAPSLEEEIPSETVSAAVKALKAVKLLIAGWKQPMKKWPCQNMSLKQTLLNA